MVLLSVAFSVQLNTAHHYLRRCQKTQHRCSPVLAPLFVWATADKYQVLGILISYQKTGWELAVFLFFAQLLLIAGRNRIITSRKKNINLFSSPLNYRGLYA